MMYVEPYTLNPRHPKHVSDIGLCTMQSVVGLGAMLLAYELFRGGGGGGQTLKPLLTKLV